MDMQNIYVVNLAYGCVGLENSKGWYTNSQCYVECSLQKKKKLCMDHVCLACVKLGNMEDLAGAGT